jgi:hypothetical protein
MLGAMVGTKIVISHGLIKSQALNFLPKRDIRSARELLPSQQIAYFTHVKYMTYGYGLVSVAWVQEHEYSMPKLQSWSIVVNHYFPLLIFFPFFSPLFPVFLLFPFLSSLFVCSTLVTSLFLSSLFSLLLDFISARSLLPPCVYFQLPTYIKE